MNLSRPRKKRVRTHVNGKEKGKKMLQQVCEYIHNYFIPKDNGVPRSVQGTFTIAGGVISPAVALKDGQRFLIAGSDLNDGVYTYHDDAIMNDDDAAIAPLTDETFTGAICPMSVPALFVAKVKEGQDWTAANGAAVNSPYTSESVQGVYSYSKSASMTEGACAALGLPPHIVSFFERFRRPFV